MSGTIRADLVRQIVVREEARIDRALDLFNGLLKDTVEPVDSADTAGVAEAHSNGVSDEPTEDLWTLVRYSARAVTRRLAFELRWRPMRVRKRLQRLREHYHDLKRFEYAAEKEAAARRREELFQLERSERHRSPHVPGSSNAGSVHRSKADG